MDLANLATLLFISGNVHPYPGPISNHPHPQAPLLHLPSGMWAEILFNALLASSGCISFASFLPVLTFAQSVQLALQWLAMPSVPSPKENWFYHSDQSPCYAACVPSPPFPQGSPTTAWLSSLTSTSGPPTLPLLHLLSRCR